jgi:hypothetical protein
MNKHEYAFDVKLLAVVRVEAVSLAAARTAIKKALDHADLDVSYEDLRGPVKVTTKASVELDDSNGPELVEVDGEFVYEDEYEEKDR